MRLSAKLVFLFALCAVAAWGQSRRALLSSLKAQASSMPSGLVLYYTFDNADITGSVVLDKSGQGNNATNFGGFTSQTGVTGQAMAFNGVNQILNAGKNTTINTLICPMTVTCWIWPTQNTSGNQAIFAQYQSVSSSQLPKMLRGGVDFSWYTCKENGGYQSKTYSPKLSSNAWSFVAAVVSNTTAAPTFYISVNSGAPQSGAGLAMCASPDTSVPVTVACDWYGGGSNEIFGGMLDELRVYNRALSSNEINTLYNYR